MGNTMSSTKKLFLTRSFQEFIEVISQLNALFGCMLTDLNHLAARLSGGLAACGRVRGLAINREATDGWPFSGCVFRGSQR